MTNVVNPGFGDNSGNSDSETNHEATTLDRSVEAAVPSIIEYELEQEKIDAIYDEADQKALSFKATQKAIKKRVKDEFNINSDCLNLKIKERKQQREMEAKIEALEEVSRDQWDLFQEKFDAYEAA